MDPSTAVPAIPDSVIDYPARDMTITVGAGMSFGRLREVLLQEQQQLPIDVPSMDWTIGALIEADVAGPRQFGYGTLRDYVIGIEAVDGKGRVFHAGGRVVKNVAGYDLCRLMVGSGQELGQLRQVTLKLKPLPPATTVVVAGFRTLKDLDSALERLNLTSATPVILDVLAGTRFPDFPAGHLPEGLAKPLSRSDAAAVLVAGFEGTRTACEWQVRTISNELQGTAAWIEVSSPGDSAGTSATEAYCRAAQQFSFPDADDRIIARISILPSRVVAAITAILTTGGSVVARAGNGVVFADLQASAAEMTASQRDLLTNLKRLCAECGGSLDVRGITGNWSTGMSEPVTDLSRKLRQVLGAS